MPIILDLLMLSPITQFYLQVVLFVPFHAVSCRFVPFRAVSFRFVPFRAVSSRSVPSCPISYRSVPCSVFSSVILFSVCVVAPHCSLIFGSVLRRNCADEDLGNNTNAVLLDVS